MTFPYVADCWFLTGPTAAGKSAVGIELARRLNGEIVSLDSMALYRGMDIGTAKPSPAERAAVPHHLIDTIEPHETFSLAQYVAAATASVGEILARRRTPIFVGGTPLYLKALLRGIFQGPPADWQFREHMTAEAAHRGACWLHEQVGRVDPAAASRLHPQDTKRLVRVLEVYEKTGQPISDLQRQFDHARPPSDCRVFVLDWPRVELYRRINARVEQMFAAGLVDEVRGLLQKPLSPPGTTQKPLSPPGITQKPLSPPGRGQGEGLEDQAACPSPQRSPRGRGGFVSLSRTAGQALGYREVLEHLAGEHSLAETIELVQNRTRAFARRQLTWFRSLSECRWVACGEQDTPQRLAARIIADGA